MDSIFECGICFKAYNHNEKKPMSLPCGHSFCSECVHKLPKHGIIQCPYDKSTHQITPDNLPVNYQVLTGLPMTTTTNPAASTSQMAESQIQMCVQHPQKKVKFYCMQDRDMFCSKCILKHTQQQHTVINCSPKGKFWFLKLAFQPRSRERHMIFYYVTTPILLVDRLLIILNLVFFVVLNSS